VQKKAPPLPKIIVIDAGAVQVGERRWALKGFSAPRIEGARCQEERIRGIQARDRLEQLLASARSEIAVYPEGRFDRWFHLARLTVDGNDVGPIIDLREVRNVIRIGRTMGMPRTPETPETTSVRKAAGTNRPAQGKREDRHHQREDRGSDQGNDRQLPEMHMGVGLYTQRRHGRQRTPALREALVGRVFQDPSIMRLMDSAW
jgi:hypothetical protein